MRRAGEDAFIFIEARDSQLPQRFTCAHELGHYIERTDVQTVPDDDFGFVDRRHARTGNLLMPGSEVRRFASFESDAIKMAGYFGVSIPAMKTRMLKLGLLSYCPTTTMNGWGT
jgi:Zn-dependent peptidase ImmA (M78 family)